MTSVNKDPSLSALCPLQEWPTYSSKSQQPAQNEGQSTAQPSSLLFINHAEKDGNWGLGIAMMGSPYFNFFLYQQVYLSCIFLRSGQGHTRMLINSFTFLVKNPGLYFLLKKSMDPATPNLYALITRLQLPLAKYELSPVCHIP